MVADGGLKGLSTKMTFPHNPNVPVVAASETSATTYPGRVWRVEVSYASKLVGLLSSCYEK